MNDQSYLDVSVVCVSTNRTQVVNADVCWRLVELLMHRSWRVTKPALRAIGNIVCAEDEQVRVKG